MLRKFVPGIDISMPPDLMAATEGFELVSRLIASHCSGASGFWPHGDSITLDASECTGGLIDRAEVMGIESHPFGEHEAWLDPFKERCTAGEPVRFRLRDGTVMMVSCDPGRIERP